MIKPTVEDCKNEIAILNNFDSFKKAVRYTFNRKLLQSEEEFLNKIIDESMKRFADKSFSLSDFPENRPLYKDSGLWQMRSDDMEEVLVQQKVNESDAEFIERCKNIKP